MVAGFTQDLKLGLVLAQWACIHHQRPAFVVVNVLRGMDSKELGHGDSFQNAQDHIAIRPGSPKTPNGGAAGNHELRKMALFSD